MNINKEQEIINYIDQLIEELSKKYPNMNFNSVRSNAISTFTSMNGDLEYIKLQIDSSFSNAETNMLKNIQESNDVDFESFEMTEDELLVYNQLKQENLDKRQAMGLNNSKKLMLTKPGVVSNNGYISFIIIMGIVLIVLVILVVLVCNVLI